MLNFCHTKILSDGTVSSLSPSPPPSLPTSSRLPRPMVRHGQPRPGMSLLRRQAKNLGPGSRGLWRHRWPYGRGDHPGTGVILPCVTNIAKMSIVHLTNKPSNNQYLILQSLNHPANQTKKPVVHMLVHPPWHNCLLRQDWKYSQHCLFFSGQRNLHSCQDYRGYPW